MDELIDVLDADGNYTGKCIMKSEAHRKGIFHPSIHVWLYNKNGEILIQQRAKNKDTHPGLWDVSVAGHIGAGEDIVESAIREVKNWKAGSFPKNMCLMTWNTTKPYSMPCKNSYNLFIKSPTLSIL